MKTTNVILSAVVAAAAVFILVAISNTLVGSKAMPSLPEYIASSTQALNGSATSTLDTASSTAAASIVPDAGTAPAAMSASLIHAPGGDIYVQIAETPDQMSLGLGDRDSLSANQGMLFVFPQPGVYSFWMKDMHFPLDMVWIGTDKKVAGVTADISPDTYPNTFQPQSAISYVLELNAGAAKQFGIKTGTVLKF